MDSAERGQAPGERLRQLAEDLAGGVQHEVHYDPTNPEESYLAYAGNSASRKRLVPIGVGCIVVGVIAVVGGKVLAD
jgi:hypothetical protein